MGLFADLLGPIKEITDLTSQVKDDATSLVGQVVDDITQIKTEGESLVSDVKSTITGEGGESDQA